MSGENYKYTCAVIRAGPGQLRLAYPIEARDFSSQPFLMVRGGRKDQSFKDFRKEIGDIVDELNAGKGSPANLASLRERLAGGNYVVRDQDSEDQIMGRLHGR